MPLDIIIIIFVLPFVLCLVSIIAFTAYSLLGSVLAALVWATRVADHIFIIYYYSALEFSFDGKLGEGVMSFSIILSNAEIFNTITLNLSETQCYLLDLH